VNEPKLTIGEVARQAGPRSSAIRFYEDIKCDFHCSCSFICTQHYWFITLEKPISQKSKDTIHPGIEPEKLEVHSEGEIQWMITGEGNTVPHYLINTVREKIEEIPHPNLTNLLSESIMRTREDLTIGYARLATFQCRHLQMCEEGQSERRFLHLLNITGSRTSSRLNNFKLYRNTRPDSAIPLSR